MNIQKKYNKEKILSWTISFIITIFVGLVGLWILNKIHFFDQISKIYLILGIFVFEFFLFFLVIQKIVYQYFQYKKKIFGEMFKYKIITYVIFNLGIIFFIFTSFIIYFNFNNQRRFNYYKINNSLEVSYSMIINLISKDRTRFLDYSKTINSILKNLYKPNNDNNNSNNNNSDIDLYQNKISIYKNLILKNKNNILNLFRQYKVILLLNVNADKEIDESSIIYLNKNYRQNIEKFIEYGKQIKINKSFIKNIDSQYFIFVKSYDFLYIFFPDQNIYKLNEKIYPGYITFKSEFSVFKYTPVLYLLYFAFLFIPLLFLQIFLTIDFINKLNRPLKILLTGFEKFDEIEFSKLKNYKINDEFYFLLNKFNLMQRELNKNRIYKRYKDRYDIYKLVTTKFAHEIKNPLTPITLSAQLIRKKYPYKDNFQEYLNKKINIILENSQIIKNIIEKIYNFSDLKKEENAIFNFNEFLQDLKSTWDSEKIKIDIEFKFNFDINIKGSITDFYSIFNNLIINSINASNGFCEIKIKVSITSNKYNNNVSSEQNSIIYDEETRKNIFNNIKSINIDYYDNGPGISKDIQKFVFEPFFTTNINGSGLGLAIIRSTLEKYNGKINYIDDYEGAHFKIVLDYNNK